MIILSFNHFLLNPCQRRDQFNKSQQMNQKFILSAEKTAKKVTLFSDQKPKKFSRKRSDGQRSIDSKRSRENSVSSFYIKNAAETTPNFNQLQVEPLPKFEEFALSFGGQLERNSNSRKLLYTRTNTSRERAKENVTSNIRLEMLEMQIKAKDGEIERLKLGLDEQRQKRRKSEGERRAIVKQIQELEKSNEKLSIQNKKLLKEREYFIKQVQFLEKINYDDKTRQLQSFREVHMTETIGKLKDELKARKSSKENELEQHCQELRHQRDSANEVVISMKSLVEVLRARICKLQKDLLEDSQITKEKIMVSQPYLEIKERYRRFIETYKEIRTQNFKLKKILQGKQQDLVLSDSDQETKR